MAALRDATHQPLRGTDKRYVFFILYDKFDDIKRWGRYVFLNLDNYHKFDDIARWGPVQLVKNMARFTFVVSKKCDSLATAVYRQKICHSFCT